MSVRAALFAALAVALLAPTPAAAQGSGVTRRQINAGTLAADGYTRAVSKAGDLQVDMPCKYTEMGIADPKRYRDGEHVANTGTVMVCTDLDAQPFVIAMRSQYTTGAAGADHFFAQQIEDDRKDGEVEEFQFNGNRAFRSLVIEDGACKWNTSVRHGDELMSVAVLVIGKECRKREAEARRSMDSLVFE